ncbi:pilus assembly protein PilO [Rivularia sp. UHCC 0363]|uniref:pilus assembly protein PilO n=1 Tax=Rivularia sp. UHCC 0363 TaxID=3110244 RepID=UPI002B21A887|nr:pilus assembly protein PilO [Rivularia sp. UHCC 0363]MEA5599213.1 pilus assembly protein PilO [Rivularia sp. UHCC 0363]
MTYSEEMNFESGLEEESSPYPVIFGITFTPIISGVLIGLLGVAGAAYLLLNFVMPAWETFGQKQSKQQELEGQVEQKKASLQNIDKIKAELALAKRQQSQVLAVFANEKTLDTLLIDLNRLVEAGNVQLSANAVKAKLEKFTPDSQGTQPVTDGSLGAAVDGKLKRSSTEISISGTYEQTQSILRNIERLQPLLLVKDYQSTLLAETIKEGEPTRVGPTPITTNFKLEALVPMNPQEAAAAKKEEVKK